VEAVVVLGFGNRGSRINLVNRYRVRAALRSRSAGTDSLLVVCGGAVAGAVPEADLLAAHARALGYRGRVAFDRESRSTWENVRNAIPYLEDADQIKIVSNSLHSEKARIYLARMRPDLAARLRRADEHRFGELVLVKPFAAIRGLWELRGARRSVTP
jgi:uncharacterized SAM-binding protein YcdF (DUF218 family)